MPKVTAEYRDARRDEIAAAALRCFAAKGFKGTSMADIIAESGLSAGAIYGHFASKHEIMMSVAKKVVGHRLDDLREYAADRSVPPPGEVVARMMVGMAGEGAQPPVLVQIWGEATVEEGMREMFWSVFSDVRSTYEAYFVAWAKEHDGLDDDAAHAWARALMPIALGMAQGYIVQSALFEHFDAAAYLESVRTILPH